MSSDNLKIGFIGFGFMAQNLCRGFLKSQDLGVKPEDVICFDKNTDGLTNALQSSCFDGVRRAGSNCDVVRHSKVVIIAVKPYVVHEVLEEIRSCLMLDQHVVISIAAGITIANMENFMPIGSRVIRVMPNAAVAVLHGATVVSRGTAATDEDESLAVKLFSSVGYCTSLPESHLNTVTAISGSGPAYAFMAIDAAGDGGSMQGLPRNVAQKLAAHTMIGAAQMFLETGQHPMALKDSICSDGGTTLYGINHLESGNFRALVAGAIKAGHDRAVELGRPSSANH